MNKKLFIMALCMVGHSGYAVDRENTQQQEQQQEQEKLQKLNDAIEFLRKVQGEDWTSKNLEALQKELWNNVGLSVYRLGDEFQLRHEAKHDEFFRLWKEVDDRINEEKAQRKETEWENLSSDQKEELIQKLDQAMQKVSEINVKNWKDEDLAVLERKLLEAGDSLSDKDGHWPYLHVPALKPKYNKLLEQQNQVFGLIHEERDRRAKQQEEDRETAIEGAHEMFDEEEKLARQKAQLNENKKRSANRAADLRKVLNEADIKDLKALAGKLARDKQQQLAQHKQQQLARQKQQEEDRETAIEGAHKMFEEEEELARQKAQEQEKLQQAQRGQLNDKQKRIDNLRKGLTEKQREQVNALVEKLEQNKQ